jgi:glycosyltransferase involved in cell wall biosynthesis
MSPLTVTWFVPVRHRDYNRMPASVWNRCLQMLPYLERLGVRCLVNDRRTPAEVVVFVRMQDADALALARAVRARGARVVFDLCVNYYDVTGLTAGGYGVTERHRADCLAMTETADAITTASAFIAARAREHHPRVAYLPDSVDRAHFSGVKRYDLAPGGRPRAIWCGFGVKGSDVEPILPLLRERDMPLTMIADSKPRLSAPFEYVRWRHQSLPRDLLRGDVCVAPRVLDNPYDRGHSFFKIGIFMTEGVPAIASPVPSYADVLHPEKTGLVCPTLDDWAAALDRIVAEPGLLATWSTAAMETMRPYWSENLAAEYAALFRGLTG